MTQNTAQYDVCAVGNAIVDVLSPCDAAFLTAQDLAPNSMQLVDAERSAALYDAMAPGVEASGGSAGNTVASARSAAGRPISARWPMMSWARCSATTSAPPASTSTPRS